MSRGTLIRRLDRFALAGIAAGVACMLQPWWPGGFAAGFFITLAATVMQIVTSHLLPSPESTEV